MYQNLSYIHHCILLLYYLLHWECNEQPHNSMNIQLGMQFQHPILSLTLNIYSYSPIVHTHQSIEKILIHKILLSWSYDGLSIFSNLPVALCRLSQRYQLILIYEILLTIFFRWDTKWLITVVRNFYSLKVFISKSYLGIRFIRELDIYWYCRRSRLFPFTFRPIPKISNDGVIRETRLRFLCIKILNY